MQLFILSENIDENVKMYCDKHCVKLITEVCQMLSTIHRVSNYYRLPGFLYKKTHVKHPCTVWGGESLQNYWYLCHTGLALYNEYVFRFNKVNNFKRARRILFWCINHPIKVQRQLITPFAQAMPDKYKRKNPVSAYRAYYIGEKRHIFKWTKRPMPTWIKKRLQQEGESYEQT